MSERWGHPRPEAGGERVDERRAWANAPAERSGEAA